MDYNVLKPKFTMSDPAPPPKPSPPAPPSPPHEGPAPPRPRLEPIPFIGGGYTEELDRMSRIPGMRNFEVTYSNTYRWNLMDPMDKYGQPMAYRGMRWVPTAHPPQTLPPRALQRQLGPPPEYGRHGQLIEYDYPYVPPSYGGRHLGHYLGGGGYYGDQHPEDCRVM